MRFLVLGSANIDMVFSVDRIVNPGETISSRTLFRNAGGKGANQAAALAKAGTDVSFAGNIGKDGIWLLDKLSSYGVDVSLSNVSDEGFTGQAIIQVDDSGENAIVLYPGMNRNFTEEHIDNVLNHFSSGDYLVLQNEINLVDYAIAEAKKRGMRIVLNPSPFDSEIEKFPLDLVDIFFVNENEGAKLLNEVCDDYEEMARKLSVKFISSSIIMTAGSNGSYFAEKGNVIHAEAEKVTAVDTTGAGDTFTGFFLSAISSDRNAEDALRIANRAAGIAVSRKGAMEAIPDIKEVFQSKN